MLDKKRRRRRKGEGKEAQNSVFVPQVCSGLAEELSQETNSTEKFREQKIQYQNSLLFVNEVHSQSFLNSFFIVTS